MGGGGRTNNILSLSAFQTHWRKQKEQLTWNAPAPSLKSFGASPGCTLWKAEGKGQQNIEGSCPSLLRSRWKTFPQKYLLESAAKEKGLWWGSSCPSLLMKTRDRRWRRTTMVTSWGEGPNRRPAWRAWGEVLLTSGWWFWLASCIDSECNITMYWRCLWPSFLFTHLL